MTIRKQRTSPRAPVCPGVSAAGMSANMESVAAASFCLLMLSAGSGDERVRFALCQDTTVAAFWVVTANVFLIFSTGTCEKCLLCLEQSMAL